MEEYLDKLFLYLYYDTVAIKNTNVKYMHKYSEIAKHAIKWKEQVLHNLCNVF